MRVLLEAKGVETFARTEDRAGTIRSTPIGYR